jgi:hypothetical protein
MSFAKGYYSIIQYCPDPSRLEAVNIGVALFCPELRFLKAKFGRRRTKVSQVFGKQDWEFVALQQSAIEARLAREQDAFEKLEDFEAYVSRRANALTLTSPRSVKVDNPERELKHLLRRLVGSQGETAQRAARISKELGNLLRSAGVGDRLQRDVTVHPPSLPKPMKVPFAYRNGKLNLIDPIQFEGQTASTIFNRTSVQAVEGEFLADYTDPKLGNLSLVIVANFTPDQKHEQETAETVFKKHGVQMYTFRNLEPLIEDIRLHSH